MTSGGFANSCCEIQPFESKKNERSQACVRGPTKSPRQDTRKRPDSCVDTILPDTFHLILTQT